RSFAAYLNHISNICGYGSGRGGDLRNEQRENMKAAIAAALAVTGWAISGPALAEDGEASTIVEAFTEGDLSLSLRYRLALIDDDGVADTATASTLRTLFGYKTKPIGGASIFVQGRNVAHLGDDDFNDTLNGKTTRPVEADPEATALHQAFLHAKPVQDTQVWVGRRIIALDNQRFIGSLVWRQNDRSFDGATVTNTSLPDTELSYTYAFNVNRAFTNESPVGNFDEGTNIHMISGGYSGLAIGKIKAYAYLVDLDGFAAAQGLSTATFGGYFEGAHAATDAVKLLYRAEVARQTDYAGSPFEFAATYAHLNGGAGFGPFTVKAGWELLGSDDGVRAVTAPLGLLHAFNGWADRFLATPADGLEDLYVSAAFKTKDVGPVLDALTVKVIYHDFSSDEGSRNFGQEWDVLVAAPFLERYSAAVKAAWYDADEFSTDVQKIWFTLAAKF
ncbi:MAG: alginate export family protein, partial [Pseudomonadota bacterium]